jgi:hypothetical protein
MSASVLAIVAHPDDDLLFLNPDLDAGIHAGIPTTVVYVSAGDALLPRDEGAVRARDRQRGIQDAYRVSGSVGDLVLQDEWDGEVVEVGGRLVEEFALRDRPDVRATFVGLPTAVWPSCAPARRCSPSPPRVASSPDRSPTTRTTS